LSELRVTEPLSRLLRVEEPLLRLSELRVEEPLPARLVLGREGASQPLAPQPPVPVRDRTHDRPSCQTCAPCR
jgi:hypothetical protein